MLRMGRTPKPEPVPEKTGESMSQQPNSTAYNQPCLLYTSDAADE